MIKKTNLAKSNLKSGFSIIELTIVFAVVGLLMAIAWGGWKFLDNAKVTQATTQLTTLDTAIETFRQSVRRYPNSLEELITGPNDSTENLRWDSSFLEERDLIDPWKKAYQYDLYDENANPPYKLYTIHKNQEIKSAASKPQ